MEITISLNDEDIKSGTGVAVLAALTGLTPVVRKKVMIPHAVPEDEPDMVGTESEEEPEAISEAAREPDPEPKAEAVSVNEMGKYSAKDLKVALMDFCRANKDGGAQLVKSKFKAMGVKGGVSGATKEQLARVLAEVQQGG